jgi:tetratricopeptide (TPR) repeat protein
MPLRHALSVVVAALVVACGGCEKKVVETPKGAAGKPFELNVNRRPSASLLERAQKNESSYDSVTGAPVEVGPYGAAQTGGVLTFGTMEPGLASARGKTAASNGGAAANNPVFDARLLDVETVDKRYKESFDQGEKLLQAGQFDQALVKFDEAKTIDPKNHLAYVGEAFCYFNKKDFGKSLAAIDFAIASSPNTLLLYHHRSQIRAQLNDFTGAIDDMSRVIKANPRDVAALSQRAQFQMQLANFTAAVNDFTAALKERPGEVVCLINRGWAYFRMDRYEKSAADAGAALAMYPNLIDAFFLRSAARLRMQDMAGGKSDFDQAVRLGLDERMAAQLRPAYYPAAGNR